jgi:RNA polymerase-interacting CarD/CdnL/TRCF family regulator
MESEQTYSSGDWIVHRSYGVGQIRGIDIKKLEGDEVTYFKVRTRDSTYWLPVDKTHNSRIRPISSSPEFKQVISILKRPSREMDSDYKERRKRISKVEEKGSLEAITKLVRDLAALQAERGLNVTEERAFDRLSKRLISEWSACMKIEFEDAQQRFFKLLQVSNL